MSSPSPDQMVFAEDWSDLARFRPMPEIDHGRLRAYRRGRLVSALYNTPLLRANWWFDSTWGYHPGSFLADCRMHLAVQEG